MRHRSRGYQTNMRLRAKEARARGKRVVMPVLPTGSGKTFTVSQIIEEAALPTACMAHRGELVEQMSMALAREGISHTVVGSADLGRNLAAAHYEEFGRSFYNPASQFSVCSVDTLIKLDASHRIFTHTGMWVVDEGHHLLKANKWGKAVQKFREDCWGIAPTATPCRADGKGLGRHADGLVDEMLEGPSMKWMIENGYLTGYRCVVAQSDLDINAVRHTASGDFNQQDLAVARKKSRITGDLVKTYQRWIPGKLTVVFDVDVESATATAAAYRAAGIPAEVLTGETPPTLRRSVLRRFKRREILVLTNVDLFGEGFDLPAIEAVQLARPTESFSLFAQQWGRALRLMISEELQQVWDDLTPEQRAAHIAASDKPAAVVIDHVGNVVRHRGPPDVARQWTLDGASERSKGRDPDAVPVTSCLNEKCLRDYPRYKVRCPYCQTKPEPAERKGPEFVDGDLLELDPEVMQRMWGEVARVDGPALFPRGVAHAVRQSINKLHVERQEAQAELREWMALWGGWKAAQGFSDREIQKLFFFAYATDVATAQALGRPDALKLAARIERDLEQQNIKRK